MKFLLAKKINMTQVFGEDGSVEAVTALQALPLVVTQVKTKENDGYSAVQLGGGLRREKNLSKPVRGHLKELGNLAHLKEVRTIGAATHTRGDKIEADIFGIGDKVAVSSLSKGKGFQGVVKRHGFHGGPRSHGQKHSEREPGSIGGGGRDGGRVAKGMRMAGRMGATRVTVKNLHIVAVDKDSNTILVSGAIPGRRGSLVEIWSAKVQK